MRLFFGFAAVLLGFFMVPFGVANAVKPLPVEAKIERDGANWSVEYRLNANHKIWAFPRSKYDRLLGQSWRKLSWIVTTKGVRFAQMGGYDVLIADKDFVPRRVKILFAPWTGDLQADYDPALQFSTGDVALFDAHFNITRYDAEEGLLKSPAAQVNRFTDKGSTVSVNGRDYTSAKLSGEPTYVLFGDLKHQESERLQTIIDPGMPDWLRNNMDAFIPRLVDDFAKQFGVEGLDRKPVIWAVWGGGSRRGISTGGSVLPGFITMALKGDGLLTENKDARGQLYWFFAHEVAHFWLGQKANYAGDGHQWISEGGANAAAMLYLRSSLPSYNFRAAFENEIYDCKTSAKQGALRTGYQRREYQGYYSCGALFNLVADRYAREKGGDFFSFNGDLIKRAKTEDGNISDEEWLSAFATLSDKPSLVEAMKRLIDGHSSDTDKDIDLLIEQTGIVLAKAEKA